MKILLVGGTYDENGGKPSYFVTTLADVKHNHELVVVNGGTLTDLELMVNPEAHYFANYDAVIWMPNIDNKEDKFLPLIKQLKPELFLVQSKRVIEKDYNDFDIVKRLVQSHSALGVKVEKLNGCYYFSIIDPLGTCWAKRMTCVDAFSVLFQRLQTIGSFSRMRSQRVLDRTEFQLDPNFLTTVKQYGVQFNEIIQAINPDRFLGNASTRCAHGFPSIRHEGAIYVSQRNVDKTIINEQSFVRAWFGDNRVCYAGDKPPSVDTPIQLKLYEAYPNINYMIHGHCYIEGAPFTKNNIPCGFLEEVEEILEAVPDRNTLMAAVNLKGHGCLIMSHTPEGLRGYPLVGRPMPEFEKEEHAGVMDLVYTEGAFLQYLQEHGLQLQTSADILPIVSALKHMVFIGAYHELSTLYDQIKPSDLNPLGMIAILRSTFPSRTKIGSYDDFLDRCIRHYIEYYQEEEKYTAQEVFRGLYHETYNF